MERTRYARSVRTGATDVPFGEDLKSGILRLVLAHGDELEEGVIIDCNLGTGSAGPGSTPSPHNYESVSFGIRIQREY